MTVERSVFIFTANEHLYNPHRENGDNMVCRSVCVIHNLRGSSRRNYHLSKPLSFIRSFRMEKVFSNVINRNVLAPVLILQHHILWQHRSSVCCSNTYIHTYIPHTVEGVRLFVVWWSENFQIVNGIYKRSPRAAVKKSVWLTVNNWLHVCMLCVCVPGQICNHRHFYALYLVLKIFKRPNGTIWLGHTTQQLDAV